MNLNIICFSNNVWYSLNQPYGEVKEELVLNSKDMYITYQVSDFIRYIKSENKNFVPNIINLESLDKQFSQLGKDILDNKKWHILKSMSRENIIDKDYKVNKIGDFLHLVYEFYLKLISKKNELNRFEEIEIKINKIIHNTELGGIRIDVSKLKNKCVELHYYLYKLKNDLQFQFNIFQPDNIETQANYLVKNNFKILNNNYYETIRLNRKVDIVCNSFYEINRTAQDLKSLLYINSNFGGKEMVHPYFVGFGTVTSRIIIKEPSLQNLRKQNRDVIVANTGRKLLYIDYSQYEAGILAHFSNDKKLLNLYNQEDIYNDILDKIINKEVNSENRKEAKILFYRFLYGDDFASNVYFKTKVNSYFDSFIALMNFKNELISKSKKEGLVSSIFGNHRIVLPQNENNWIISHFIQSIASFIFKKSLIEVYDKVKEARLLMPLHDGALYEVELQKYDDIAELIRSIYINNLKLVCPRLINANAEIKDFIQ